MEVPTVIRSDSAHFQLRCAQKIVRTLFEETGLSTIVRIAPTVIIGAGNWISFEASQPVSTEILLGLRGSAGGPAFASDIFDQRGTARSKTTPSLHLTNLDSGESLRGHVDAYYWVKNPLGHAREFLTRKTNAPSELLKRLSTENEPMPERRTAS